MINHISREDSWIRSDALLTTRFMFYCLLFAVQILNSLLFAVELLKNHDTGSKVSHVAPPSFFLSRSSQLRNWCSLSSQSSRNSRNAVIRQCQQTSKQKGREREFLFLSSKFSIFKYFMFNSDTLYCTSKQ